MRLGEAIWCTLFNTAIFYLHYMIYNLKPSEAITERHVFVAMGYIWLLEGGSTSARNYVERFVISGYVQLISPSQKVRQVYMKGIFDLGTRCTFCKTVLLKGHTV